MKSIIHQKNCMSGGTSNVAALGHYWQLGCHCLWYLKIVNNIHPLNCTQNPRIIGRIPIGIIINLFYPQNIVVIKWFNKTSLTSYWYQQLKVTNNIKIEINNCF